MTADLRREEIARIEQALGAAKVMLTPSTPALLYDAGLRSQDTATARIAALEGLMDAIATDVESAAGTYWPSQIVIERVAKPIRAALSGETRTGGEP